MRLVDRRTPEIEALRRVLSGGEPIRFRSGRSFGAEAAHRMLLGHALVAVARGDAELAAADLIADWRLVRSLRGWSRGMACEVVVAVRKLPVVAPEWTERLDSTWFRDAVADLYLDAAAEKFRGAEDVPTYLKSIGAERAPLPFAWFFDVQFASDLVDQARRSVELAEEIRDPTQRVPALDSNPAWGRTAVQRHVAYVDDLETEVARTRATR